MKRWIYWELLTLHFWPLEHSLLSIKSDFFFFFFWGHLNLAQFSPGLQQTRKQWLIAAQVDRNASRLKSFSCSMPIWEMQLCFFYIYLNWSQIDKPWQKHPNKRIVDGTWKKTSLLGIKIVIIVDKLSTVNHPGKPQTSHQHIPQPLLTH